MISLRNILIWKYQALSVFRFLNIIDLSASWLQCSCSSESSRKEQLNMSAMICSGGIKLFKLRIFTENMQNCLTYSVIHWKSLIPLIQLSLPFRVSVDVLDKLLDLYIIPIYERVLNVLFCRSSEKIVFLHFPQIFNYYPPILCFK